MAKLKLSLHMSGDTRQTTEELSLAYSKKIRSKYLLNKAYKLQMPHYSVQYWQLSLLLYPSLE
jgi:hypothetical protein